MKHILPRNHNFPGLLLLLPGFIFHLIVQFLSPPASPGTIDSDCIPVKPYPVLSYFIPKSFIIIKIPGSCPACFDVVHFPSVWLHPFLKCCVYKLMKDKIMNPAIQNYVFAVTATPVARRVFWVASTSNSKIYP